MREAFLRRPLTGNERRLVTHSLAEHIMTDTFTERNVLTANRWGIARAQTRGGRIESLTPIAEDPSPSPLIDRLASLPTNPQRIKHPAVRRSFLTDGVASKALRGEEGYVEVDWETALTLAAQHIQSVYQTTGPKSVWGWSYGWMNTGHVEGVRPLLQRFLNIMGGFVPCKNTYSNAAITTIQTHIVGDRDPRCSDWESVFEASERVVFWGADPVRTNDVDWFTPLHQGRANALKLKHYPHIKTYSVAPVVTDTARALHSESLLVFPGSDAAILAAMIYVLIERDLVNWDFLARCTVGYEALVDDILGKTDGIAKTPEWAAAIAGISAQTIVDLTLDLASHRTMLMMGWGPQREEHGEQAPWMAWAFAAFLGQIGLPGGGIGTNYHYDSGGNAPSLAPALKGMPTDPTGSMREAFAKGVKAVPVASIARSLLHPGEVIDFNGERVTLPDLKLVFWAGGNPFAHHPDTNQVHEAFKRPDVVICSDINWSPMARHADIVLPACTNFEVSDISRIGAYTNDGVVFTEAALPPQGEAKSNYEIFRLLAQKCGVETLFTEGLTAEGWRQRFYEELVKDAAAQGIALPDYPTAKAQGLVLFPRPTPGSVAPFVAYADFRQDPEAHPLKTPSGKIEIRSSAVASFGYDEIPPYPHYQAPGEGVGRTDDEYPLVLLTSKSEKRLHSQLDSTLTERYGPEPVRIHPEDALRYGIRAGETVLVKSRRGQVLLRAEITEGIRPGVVAVNHGSWYDPVNDATLGRVDRHGCANTLTRDVPTSRLAQGNVSSSCVVSVSPYRGALDAFAPMTLPEGITP